MDVKQIKRDSDRSSEHPSGGRESDRNKQSENDRTEKRKQKHNKTVPDRESNDTLGDLFSNLLGAENCIEDLSRDTETEHSPDFEVNLCG